MTDGKHLLIFCVMMLLSASGCDDSVSIKGPYDERIVVYGILQTDASSQWIRVASTYDPPGLDPMEHRSEVPITDAVVSITDGTMTIVARDTLIPRTDTTRYESALTMHVLSPFSPTPGAQYTVRVESPSRGTVSAAAQMPSSAIVLVGSPTSVQSPLRFPQEVLSVRAWVDRTTSGYLFLWYLEYQLVSQSGRTYRTEIPLEYSSSGGGDTVATYPELKRIAWELTGNQTTIAEVFSLNAYMRIVRDLQAKHKTDIRFRASRFLLIRVDGNTYTYHSIANGFRDLYSIRMDLPDFSNVSGGLGLVGAMTVDSSIVLLPTGFPAD